MDLTVVFTSVAIVSAFVLKSLTSAFRKSNCSEAVCCWGCCSFKRPSLTTEDLDKLSEEIITPPIELMNMKR